ncbi:MAG: transglycosylase SLT domain-containing protein [Xanthomonadales bacterium]|nr:transglycosylase SLT domain-containing protein [Xanthomonadales bacterium]
MTRFKALICLVLLIVATQVSAFCSGAETRLISEQADRHDVPRDYMLAMASVLTDCEPGYADHEGRIGLMAVNPDLLGTNVGSDPEWLFYPTVNAKAAARLLRRLLDEYSDWETVLTVYLQGNTRTSGFTRQRIQSIFGLAHGRHCISPHRGCPDLDDFGPRCRPAVCSREHGNWQPLYGRSGRARRW